MDQLQHAQLHYNETGTPVSDFFDDVYFSNENGLLETDYVFLQQNQLPERWFSHPRPFFHIMETGFGTGLNFLLTWQKFRAAKAQGAACERLYFSSFEKYPLTKTDLTQALLAWPSLAEEAKALLEVYPAAFPGPQRLVLDNGLVILDLWLGDVNALLPIIPLHNQADAWFLDGFAPSKNPDMWQESLFQGMFRLSREGCTVATFTSAGLVKRGLASAGFIVQKIKGYGRKREMLIAAHPLKGQHATEKATPEAVIVGSGIAGLLSAHSLLQKGWNITVLSQDEGPGQSASHNRQGALYPNLHADYSLMSALSTQSFEFAHKLYRRLQPKLDFAAGFCGVLQLACTDELAKRQEKIKSRPSSLYQHLSAEEASELAGIELPFPGLYFPDGAWLAPQELCLRLTEHLKTLGCHFEFSTEVLFVKTNQVTTAEKVYEADAIVLAAGADLKTLWPLPDLPQGKVRGQVSHVQAAGLDDLKTVVCHKGYLTPAYEGLHCVGATFDRQTQNATLIDADNAYNLQLVNQVLLEPHWFKGAQVVDAKAGLRATVPDHLPLLGHAQGIWTLGALAARGLTWGPLLAETLSCLLSEEPIALSMVQLDALSPLRFTKP